ncbi:hypothetical protein LTS18_007742, partial [Coniosporium uncinatum]
ELVRVRSSTELPDFASASSSPIASPPTASPFQLSANIADEGRRTPDPPSPKLEDFPQTPKKSATSGSPTYSSALGEKRASASVPPSASASGPACGSGSAYGSASGPASAVPSGPRPGTASAEKMRTPSPTSRLTSASTLTSTSASTSTPTPPTSATTSTTTTTTTRPRAPTLGKRSPSQIHRDAESRLLDIQRGRAGV